MRTHTRTLPAFLLLILLASCGERGPTVSSEMLARVNHATTAAGNAFSSMWRDEQAFADPGSRKPQSADLDVFWMSLQSTARDLTRVNRTLEENPGLIPTTRNYWNGRVQESLSKIQESGMLVDMNGPITSLLGDSFGEERVRGIVQQLFQATGSIQERLGIVGGAVPPDVAGSDPATGA